MEPSLLRYWGFWAMASGGMALLLVFAQIVAPSFEPAPSIGTQIGEIAGDIRRAAWQSFLGRPTAEPEPATTSFWVYFAIAAPIFGVLALILSAISALMRENWRFAAYGAGMAVCAIIFQFVWWLAVFIAAALLLITIVENVGDIFGA
ncbi:MAG: hypothetical protein AAGK98_19375 [Pseudomonadota bacterium]